MRLTGFVGYYTVQVSQLFSLFREVRTIKKPIKPMSNVISALTARSQFGQILEEVEKDRRSFVIEKRGSPKAILLGIQDYIRLAAPEPEILKKLGEVSVRRGTDKLSPRQIERVIKLARANRRGAGS